MKILILNGNPKVENEEFDIYLNNLQHSLMSKNHIVKQLILRDYQLHDCIGCYTCWLKTPGICCFHDGIDEILSEYLAADIVVSASPLIMDYISALLKRVNDRMLPVMHPFLKLKEDRMSHVLRYNHYPNPVLLLDKAGEIDGENSSFVEMVYRSSQRGTPKILNMQQDVEGISNEIIDY